MIFKISMNLKIIEKEQLDSFVSAQDNSQLLQSWNWSVFQEKAGHQVWRFGLWEQKKLLATAVLIEHLLPLNKSYLYCPRGPILKKGLSEREKTVALKLILSKARDLTMETKAEEIFFRLEPTFDYRSSIIGLKKTKSIQPANTLILNLAPSINELLASMHQKTRYNIRLAEKNEINIERAKETDFDQAWPLFEQTGSRDKFKLHPKSYYQKMLASLPRVELWLAKKDNAIIAANLIGFFGDTVTYLHGASDYNCRQLMAPYLLQWTVIKEAKARGFKYYDFHGIAPSENPNHPWAGITRFKKGFGGQPTDYAGTFDFIYEKNWYKLYKLFRKLNRLIK
jgi:lipid II:glycine glycyltransferase (peptidoglycan interpeptide bridge formation enzyme)